jgi:hypothetical protein
MSPLFLEVTMKALLILSLLVLAGCGPSEHEHRCVNWGVVYELRYMQPNQRPYYMNPTYFCTKYE